MLNPMRAAARIVRDWGTSTQFTTMSRAANAFAGLTNEARWWRCSEPGWWSVQTIWIGEDLGDLTRAWPVQLVIEVVDGAEPGLSAIQDWRPQQADRQYSTADRSFGHVLPGRGPVHVLAHHPPPFGTWTVG